MTGWAAAQASGFEGDMRQGVSAPVQAVLDELDGLRAHPQWGKASVEALLTEVDLLGDTVFGKQHSMKKGIDAKASDAATLLELIAVEVAKMPSAARMAAFLLLAIERAAEAAPAPAVFMSGTIQIEVMRA